VSAHAGPKAAPQPQQRSTGLPNGFSAAEGWEKQNEQLATACEGGSEGKETLLLLFNF